MEHKRGAFWGVRNESSCVLQRYELDSILVRLYYRFLIRTEKARVSAFIRQAALGNGLKFAVNTD